MTLIEQIKRDREAGTPGPWAAKRKPNFNNGYIYVSVQPVNPDPATMRHMAMVGGDFHICKMNHTPVPEKAAKHHTEARRIARVPDMESALLAAEELAAMLENCLEVLTKEDGRLCCNGSECGCYGATKHQEAEHYAKEALAAYRKATENTQ